MTGRCPWPRAVSALDDFLNALCDNGIAVIAIAGNHDSPERLEFGSRLMSGRGVHISGVYSGTLRQVTLTDEYGPVNIYLLPFIKPAMVRAVLGQEVSSTAQAVEAALRGYPFPNIK